MSVHLLREKVLERHFFLWNGFFSSLDFHKLVLRGKCGVTEILLWRLQKPHCNVWMCENMYFPWGTSFPCVQINAFMTAANVFHRWYPVLPNSQPSEMRVQGGIIDCSCVQVFLVRKKPQFSRIIWLLITTWLIDFITISYFSPFLSGHPPPVLPVVYMRHWCDSGWAISLFSPFAGGCCCRHSLMWDLAAAAPRELPGPFSGADPDTRPNLKTSVI